MDKIPAAIIGLGRIASLLEDDPLREKPCTHAGAIACSQDCFLAGGMDTDAERSALFAQKWNCPVFDSAERMLGEIQPRILHIATHPETHLDYCALAEKFCVPVVVCEKPLADTIWRAKKICAIHERGVTKIIVNHERRYAREYHAAKRIAASGDLGKLCGIKAVLYMGQDRRILDMLWHDGTHIADCVSFLVDGRLVHKKTTGSPLASREGSAFFLGEIVPLKKNTEGKPLSCAIPFCLEVGAGRDHIVFEIELSFTNGRIRIGNGVYEIWKSAPSPYAKDFRSLALCESGFGGATEYFSRMAADAVRVCRNKNAQPLSSARDAMRVIEYLTRIAKWKRR
jgi:predicted dehydrogenase